ncbi:MAG: VCBS repeat-containing protein, partial [bacterium]|nr:VCBS repeat-containing protein [bacterium]
ISYGNLSADMTFESQGRLDLGHGFVVEMALGDLDANGQSDLWVTAATFENFTDIEIGPSGRSVVYLADSLGQLSSDRKIEFPIAGIPWSVTIGDLNADGVKDIGFVYFNQEAFKDATFFAPETRSATRLRFSREAAAFLSRKIVDDSCRLPSRPPVPVPPGEKAVDLGLIEITCIPGQPYTVEIKGDNVAEEGRSLVKGLASAEVSIPRDEVWTQTGGPFYWDNFDAKEKWGLSVVAEPKMVAARAHSVGLKSSLAAAAASSGSVGDLFTTKAFRPGSAAKDGNTLAVLEGVCPWPALDFPIRGPFSAEFKFSITPDTSALSSLQAASLAGAGISPTASTTLNGKVIVTDVGLEMKGGGPKGFGGCSLVR